MAINLVAGGGLLDDGSAERSSSTPQHNPATNFEQKLQTTSASVGTFV